MNFTKFFLLPAVIAVLAGCSGYQLGSTLPEDVQSVFLRVVNNTDEPSIEVAVMKALRAEVQMDGRLKLRSENKADLMLEVTLNGYQLGALSYDRRRGSMAREYRTVLRASSVLTRSETGDVILENPTLVGDADFTYDDDLTSAKLRILSKASEDLARKVVSRVTTAW